MSQCILDHVTMHTSYYTVFNFSKTFLYKPLWHNITFLLKLSDPGSH